MYHRMAQLLQSASISCYRPLLSGKAFSEEGGETSRLQLTWTPKNVSAMRTTSRRRRALCRMDYSDSMETISGQCVAERNLRKVSDIMFLVV